MLKEINTFTTTGKKLETGCIAGCKPAYMKNDLKVDGLFGN